MRRFDLDLDAISAEISHCCCALKIDPLVPAARNWTKPDFQRAIDQ